MKKNYSFLVLLAILLLGAFLRFHKLGENSFVADEFLDINSSYAYTQTGEWKNWDFNFEKINTDNEFAPRDERAWAYKWQAATLFRFLPPTENTARSVSAFWGILTILLIYLVAKDFTRNKTIALLSAFLFAVSLDGIEFDRKLRMYAMFFPIFLAFSWTLFRFLEKEYSGENKLLRIVWNKTSLNAFYLLPALLLGALSFHLHLLTVNIVFILAGYILTLVIWKLKEKKKLEINKYTFLLGLGLVLLIFSLLFFQEKVSPALAGLGLTSHWSYVSKVLSDYQAPLLAIFFILFGIYYLWKKANLKKETLWLSWSFLGILILAVFFWDRNAGNQYIFFVQSFKIILVATGIYGLADFLRNNFSKNKSKIFGASLALSFLLLPNFGYFFQKDNFYNQTSASDNPRYREIFAYFKKNKTASDVLIARNFRNYYFAGEKVPVFDFGGELDKNKITLERLEKIIAENPSGWMIFSDNDEVFITKEAQSFIEEKMEKINNIQVRGKVSVYRWK